MAPMIADIKVEHEMDNLLKVMDKIREMPPEKQLKIIRRHIEETISAAKSGWL